jgi:hypothetical protein
MTASPSQSRRVALAGMAVISGAGVIVAVRLVFATVAAASRIEKWEAL